jgi:hypothetical protein
VAGVVFGRIFRKREAQPPQNPSPVSCSAVGGAVNSGVARRSLATLGYETIPSILTLPVVRKMMSELTGPQRWFWKFLLLNDVEWFELDRLYDRFSTWLLEQVPGPDDPPIPPEYPSAKAMAVDVDLSGLVLKRYEFFDTARNENRRIGYVEQDRRSGKPVYRSHIKIKLCADRVRGTCKDNIVHTLVTGAPKSGKSTYMLAQMLQSGLSRTPY